MAAHITWEAGGEANVLALSGEKITISSSISRAPGGPLRGALASGSPIHIKVASCKRDGSDPSAWFTIEGRLIDATRAHRAEIAALLAP